MKLLEETIKLKCKFLGNTITPLYLLPPDNHFLITDPITIFESKNSFDARDEIILLEEMTPLLVYFCSCILFSRGYYIEFLIKLHFDNSTLILDNSINLYHEGLFQNPLRALNDSIDQSRSLGYCIFFMDTFKLEFILGRVANVLSDEEEEEETKTIEKFEKVAINDLKTFKVEQCVICLENIPNVLFCNCGHLYVCKTCIMKFTNCPMCKKENTILRIIE